MKNRTARSEHREIGTEYLIAICNWNTADFFKGTASIKEKGVIGEQVAVISN